MMQAQIEIAAPIRSGLQEPFLPTIERPRGLMMKLVYAIARHQYGKVLTPLKVFAARMPLAFGQFSGKISALDKKLILPRKPRC